MSSPLQVILNTLFPPALPQGWFFLRNNGHIPDTVIIDEELLTGGPSVTEIRLPFLQRTQPRIGSSLVLLTAAVTATADLTLDESSLLTWAAKHGFQQKTFFARCPVLKEVDAPFPGRILRDGVGQRLYLCGQPSELCAACENIWDGSERPITDVDRQIIQRDETASHQWAWATAAVTNGQPAQLCYLGSLTLAEAIRPEALASIQTLREAGVSVCATGAMYRYANDPLGRRFLRVTRDDPNLPWLYPPEPTPTDLAAPVLALVNQKQQHALRLKRAAYLFVLTLLTGLACGVNIPLLIFCLSCFGSLGLFLPPAPLSSRPRQCCVIAAAVALSLLCRAFLFWADPALAMEGCSAFFTLLVTLFLLPDTNRMLPVPWLLPLVLLGGVIGALLGSAARLQIAFGIVAALLSTLMLLKIEKSPARS